jgi:Inner membrane protein YgaP-like, transmembrane domain
MKKNIGSFGRIIRIVIGLGILSLAVVGPQTPWALLGIVPLVTGIVGWCLPYHLLGMNTCGTCGKDESGKKDSCCA